ncbi:hypothetical protein OH76DRAFT_1476350 [Lentinus brumalis]|uniref:Uncharacterized protein n=1 Tax=Lentinus brumalis TaxID=2498619 RepID=A0A371CHL8_9APHY|nr:hypothetical protein OH76DRAFT_1476350 [Polyporus brumalis]
MGRPPSVAQRHAGFEGRAVAATKRDEGGRSKREPLASPVAESCEPFICPCTSFPRLPSPESRATVERRRSNGYGYGYSTRSRGRPYSTRHGPARTELRPCKSPHTDGRRRRVACQCQVRLGSRDTAEAVCRAACCCHRADRGWSQSGGTSFC